NAERFEERLMYELKSHVQERAQALAHERVQEREVPGGGRRLARARPRPRPRPRTVVAASAGLAAVIAAAVLITGNTAATSSAGTGGDAGRIVVSVSGTPRALVHIANAAYTVQQEPAGIVKLTILDARGKPDVNALRRDLAAAGVDARVLADLAVCRSPLPSSSPGIELLPPAKLPPDRVTFENGKLVYYLDTNEVSPGMTLSILFGDSLGTIGVALTSTDALPTCIFNPADH
ncbi:MAG TPA: hypothetical protein VGS97_19325, partial [Actinocrinis sp.]